MTTILHRCRQSQQQCGGADCGLYAIAYASVLAKGDHPSSMFFNQDAMRSHLHRYTIDYKLVYSSQVV